MTVDAWLNVFLFVNDWVAPFAMLIPAVFLFGADPPKAPPPPKPPEDTEAQLAAARAAEDARRRRGRRASILAGGDSQRPLSTSPTGGPKMTLGE